MAKYVLDMERFRQVARQAAAEGCVLLYNEKDTLPVKRTQTSLYLDEVHGITIKAEPDPADL